MSGDCITVLGAGSWGTALAIRLAHNHNTTILWGHEPHFMADLQDSRENTQYLPGITFPDNLLIEFDLSRAIGQCRDLEPFAVQEVVEAVPQAVVLFDNQDLDVTLLHSSRPMISSAAHSTSAPPSFTDTQSCAQPCSRSAPK